MAELKTLTKTRATHKAKLTIFKTHLQLIQSNEPLNRLQLTELGARLSKMEDLYTEYDSTQSDIENHSDIPDEQFKDREKFESEYFATIAAAREVIDRFHSAEQRAPNSVTGSNETDGQIAQVTGGPSQLRLPIIQLPSFSGRYQDWMEFHDTFTSLIHCNQSIPKINKFHYLRAALKEGAALVIRSLEFSEGNYTVAWQLLCDRYNNTRLLVNNHIQSLFDIEPITHESAQHIRNLLDTMNKNLRALQSLKLPTEHWDILIIHMVAGKLDKITNREWEEFRSTLKELPTLLDFNNFLKNRADLLETIMEKVHHGRRESFYVTQNKPIHAHNDRRYSEGSHTRATKSFIVHNNTSNAGFSCPVCKNQKHSIYHCYKFKSLPIEARIAKVKQLNLCPNCLRSHGAIKCKSGPCRLCTQPTYHNSMLHLNANAQPNHFVQPATSSSVVLSAAHNEHENLTTPHEQSNENNLQVALSATNYHDQVLLSTAVVKVTDHTGQTHTVRALLDNGSTSCFITENLCNKLKLPTSVSTTTVEGINGQFSKISKRCNVKIASNIGEYSKLVQCLVIPRITQVLPAFHIDVSALTIPTHVQLADPAFHIPATVDMLLGADIFWEILGSTHITLGKGKPSLHETKLGWLLSGVISSNNKETKSNNTVHCNHVSEIHLQNQLTKFFELETVETTHSFLKEERDCEKHYANNTKRQSDGRFVVSIPLKEPPQKLGNSYQQALSRFHSLERKFIRDPIFKQSYTNFMQEYLNLGHMSENTDFNETNIHYILPHHGVCREESLTTKLRVVFDASAKTTTGVSFNNLQMIGPTVQDDLVSILLRFRQHKYVVTSDIEKMYRQILVNDSQQDLQQILWRFEPSEPIKVYKLHTVTYGTASAPYLATKCVAQLGQDCVNKAVAEAISRDFYVDDWLSGADSEDDLIHICKGVIDQLEGAKFHLRKWRSNNSTILNKIHEKHNTQSSNLLNLDKDQYSKTLGLLWDSKEDILLYSVKIHTPTHINKRTILSAIAQIFDPLGLLSPCILQVKIILQKLWSLKLSWDETIPSEMQIAWLNILNNLQNINNLKISRNVVVNSPTVVELHVFSDASVHAYSACIYLRCVSDTTKSVQLLIGKTKVAPLKPLTIPRLELCGALLATKLAKKVLNSLRINIQKCIFWCDSTIVIGWLRTSTSKLKPFVHNRVCEIQEHTSSHTWRYVPTYSNPADVGSRGLNGAQLKHCSIWWTGPPFLKQDEAEWPVHPIQTTESDLPELKVQCNHISQSSSITDLIHNISSFIKLTHITAYIQRFINNCRNPNQKDISHLKVHELNSALYLICKLSQTQLFSEEMAILSQKKHLSPKNKLISLNPFIDNNGLLRVGGRLSNSDYDYDTKHPIILHASHHISKLIFVYYHKVLLHSGPQMLLSSVRQKFWTINGRNLARSVVRNCVKCCRFSGRISQPIMGNLPAERITANVPFSNTAVDYAGPILIANRKGRGCSLIKSYICVFVCLSIKAVHLELVTDLTKEGFIASLSRFIARRGKPVNIFSDNGTCFVGACNELARFLKRNNDDISAHCSDLSINFKFSPAYSPHFNGLVEGSVKSVKHHLKRVLSAHLTFEEMYTALTQIESILNSRPITPLSSDPSDLVPLTPAHFLIGRTLTMLPHSQIPDKASCHLPRHLRIEQMKSHFWNRYYKEYLSELQARQKWRKDGDQLRINDMVLVKDDRLPPNRWLLGRITTVFPGSDGIARVADILTTSGTMRRAFNRLCLLPRLEQNVPRPGTCLRMTAAADPSGEGEGRRAAS